MEFNAEQSKLKIIWRQGFFSPKLKSVVISSERDEESAEFVLVQDGSRLILMNRSGVVREYNNLDIQVQNIELWEYKNNIMTLLLISSTFEYYMVQIEELSNFSLQIIQNIPMVSFSRSAKPSHSSVLAPEPHVTNSLILSTLPSANQKPVICLNFDEFKGIDVLANDAALELYGIQELGLQLSSLSSALVCEQGLEVVYKSM